MKTIIAAAAASIALLSISLPASADYTNPNASRLQQSTMHGG